MSRFNPGDNLIVARGWADEHNPALALKVGTIVNVLATMGQTVQLRGFPENCWFDEDRFQLANGLKIDLGEVTVDRVDDIIKERATQWGDAESTHSRIGDVWSGILGIDVSARQVALCMAGLKLVRAEINPGNEDSYVDGHAYLRFAEDFAQ